MTRRSQKISSPMMRPIITKRIENSWVMYIKDSLLKNKSFRIITLPHPAHDGPTKYCLDEEHKKVYEIVTFNEPYRSWLIGETVKSDGSIMLVTPINPIFLVLPRLREQCKSRAVPLEDLLSEKGFDKIKDFVCNMDEIAELKGSVEMNAYKYNEEKTLNWLKNKVHKLATVLKKKNLHVTSGASSATFVASTLTNDSVDEEFYLKYAHGILSEYLQDDLAELLEKQFDFKAELIESIGKKRKSEAHELIETHKKVKICEQKEEMDTKHNDSTLNSIELKKQKTLSAKEKARQKAASGTKTISAFFTKK